MNGPDGDSAVNAVLQRDLRSLAAAFANLGEQVDAKPTEALGSLVSVTRERVTGADSVSVTTLRRGQFVTAAATDHLAREVDAAQYEVGSGPCVDAALDATIYRTGDIKRDTRWPEFGRRAAELGVASMLSYRLNLGDDDTVAALNLFSRDEEAFDDESATIGLLLATHGAVAVMASKGRLEVDNLTRALESNRLIGTAMGILMSTHHLTQQQSFDLLSVVSQNTNRKLADIAADVVAHGDLEPGVETPRS
ncbi:MAG: GAF and ANTAR domain-containing protein [Ornithinibacter sp.]